LPVSITSTLPLHSGNGKSSLEHQPIHSGAFQFTWKNYPHLTPLPNTMIRGLSYLKMDACITRLASWTMMISGPYVMHPLLVAALPMLVNCRSGELRRSKYISTKKSYITGKTITTNTKGNARCSSKTEAIQRFQYHQAREKLKDESNVGAAEDELEPERLWHENYPEAETVSFHLLSLVEVSPSPQPRLLGVISPRRLLIHRPSEKQTCKLKSSSRRIVRENPLAPGTSQKPAVPFQQGDLE
ncbi:hypothetical protein U0070_012532, partial [Myodes glareolus]